MEKKPVRQPLRLAGYDYAAAGVYFVTICTKDRACMLGHIRPLPTPRENAPLPGAACSVGADARIGPQSAPPPPPVFVELTPRGQIVERHLQMWHGILLYAIMPDHIHFLLHIPASTRGTMQASSPTQAGGPAKNCLSQQVRMFKARVTRAAGRPLFQRSFYDRVVRSEEELNAFRQYIQYNPQRWFDDRYYEHPKGE